MRIVVTGASGRLGNAVVMDLLEHGFDVNPTDIKPQKDSSRFPVQIVDLTNADETARMIEGADAIAHLGNIPGFSNSVAPKGFSNNVVSTFNVFHAAAKHGVKHIVYASSIQAYGCFKNDPRDAVTAPKYLPLDENHSCEPANGYALSKRLGECIAASACAERSDLSAYSLRFTYIVQSQLSSDDPPHLGPMYHSMATFIQMKDAERAVRLALKKPRFGHTALNIVSPEPFFRWSLSDFTRDYAVAPESNIPSNQKVPISFRRAQEVLSFTAEVPLFQNR